MHAKSNAKYVADFFLRLEWLNSHQQCVFQIYAYEVYINKCVFVLPQRAVRTYQYHTWEAKSLDT